MEMKLSAEFIEQNQKMLWKRYEETMKMKEEAESHFINFSETGDMNELILCIELSSKIGKELRELSDIALDSIIEIIIHGVQEKGGEDEN